MSETPHLHAAREALAGLADEPPKVAMVLGSGLGGFAESLQASRSLAFADVPGLVPSTVAGHAGRFVFGYTHDVPILAMQGRIHLYEGHTPAQVVLGVRAMLHLGAEVLLLTNAAGGVNPAFRPGQLMLIEDHLNLTGHNCLTGENDATLGPRFPDMSDVYPASLRDKAVACAGQDAAELVSGVYAGLLGPSYETPAEIRMLRTLGADAVGMSTVLEAIAARHMDVPCLGISCITNPAAGLSPVPLSHEEVQQTAARARGFFRRLLTSLVEVL